MTTMSPLSQLSTSPPELARTEAALHWGAAVGGLLAGAAWLLGTITFQLGLDVVPTQQLNRMSAASVLLGGFGVALAGVCVHVDTAAPRRWSWLAVVVAMVAYTSSLPSWWVLFTGEFDAVGQSSTGSLCLVWMAVAGLVALVAGTWRPWLAAVTFAAGAGLLLLAQLPLGWVGAVAVALLLGGWSVVFAAAFLLGPHRPWSTGGAGGGPGASGLQTVVTPHSHLRADAEGTRSTWPHG